MTYQNRVLLRQSQCDYVSGHPWVCCADQPQTHVIRLDETTGREARSFLLTAGESICGKPSRSLEDRIYGGDETALGEFPW